uniref:Uncharacterized protein n=1 Tax=Mycena chlorophos TaxID=658473 RepID=A0ABQ0LZ67_MYCCL|nr:predicted protein [Mycena chlorophos]
MRKTSYAVSALAVVATTIFAVVALTRIDWIVATYHSDALGATFEAKYGLHEMCTRLLVQLPGKDDRYEHPECRAFPTREDDQCNEDNRLFCTLWSTARYASELAIGFGAVTLVTIAIGITTHSRRRRIWRVVASLLTIQALLELAVFAIVVDQFRTAGFPNKARLGPGLWLTTVAWIFGVLSAIATIVTGIAADNGKRWAAGNRAYQPILG